MLVAYSDGVPDAVNEQDEAYGTARLINLLAQNRSAPAADVCAAIFNDVFAFRGSAPAFDDITVLVARCEDGR
jgi:serine phosphatase RsbU (regulator of sigma subunit)